MLKKYFFVAFLVTGIAGQLKAQKAQTSDMASFMDKRFGMFIHFGPVTLRGTEIGWSRGDQVAAADYDNLYKEFNPVLFNANAWVKAAKDAGMKYLTITAKHHDGFCLWPTAYSTYNIAYSPFKRDIIQELAVACKKQGMTFCIYFTVLDWHDSDYPLHHMLKDTPGDMPAFVQRMKNELRELITTYHPAMLWFDGYWEKPWTNIYGRDIYNFIKSVDPHVLVNNRLGKESEKLNAESVGDFLTPEQRIGRLNMTEPWESCITICKQWAWKPNDEMKSLKECIQTLAKTAGGNGNLLFNVGPMMDGRIEERQVARLTEIGNWLKVNGSAIYGTKGGPYEPTNDFASTRKDNHLFVHIFKTDQQTIILPPLPADIKIERAHWMNGQSVVYEQTDSGVKIKLPVPQPDENDSVVILELNKSAEQIAVIKAETKS